MTTAADPLIHFALERGLLRPEQIESARRRIAARPADPAAPAPDLLEWLVAEGEVDPRALGRTLAEAFGMPFLEIGDRPVTAEALAALPRAFVLRHGVFPVSMQEGRLLVAVPDPLDVDLLDSLGHVAPGPVQPGVAVPADIRSAIARHYGRETTVMEELIGDLAAGAPPAAAQPSAQAAGEPGPSDAPLIKLVHGLIAEAVRRRASDIHLEPLERRFRVRQRIDGVLVEVASPPKRLQLAVVSRLKIMANISIAEKRVPQDGRIQLTLDGRSLDLRVSSLPTAHGESLVLRILDQQGLRPGLAELGLHDDDEAEVRRLIAAPDGILLVTGPTGSGKTTTLYGCLHHLNQAERKIITVEDPVEYQMPGINQVPVRPEIGMTFAAALRAMLRQAPNVVMVGEIRDRETAEIAINASLTGHLVFSTLHTNDAPGAVTRLADIGAKPFLIAAALRATLAQRLVRRICPHCRRRYAPAPRELHAVGLTAAQAAGAGFAHGAGCAQCNGTGYQGRMGIFEFFRLNDDLRALICDRAGPARLRARARRDGMRTMREDGVRKVLAGLTTIEEVASVTVGDTD